MKMKKYLAISLAALLAFCACTGKEPESGTPATYRLDRLTFDFRIDREPSTKGVRSGWRADDRIFIFFSGVNDAYLTITYDGSAWSAPVLTGSTPSLDQSGILTAIHLPYGNDQTPEWDSTAQAWTVTGSTDYYFLRAEKATFYITDMGDQLASLGSYLYMDNADDYVQFFIPEAGASGAVRFACNAIHPAGFAGVSLDAAVSDQALTPGGWISARADTIDGETGYYGSGKLYARPGVYYYFALDEGGTYRHYYKQRDAAITGHRAFQLPALSAWPEAGPAIEVTIAGNGWRAVNIGADNPWQSGSLYAPANMDDDLPSDTQVPADGEWDALMDRYNTAWVQISVAGTDGYVVIDRYAPENYIFLPCGKYWTSSLSAGVSHYFEAGTNDTKGIYDSAPPAEAYVRPVSSLYLGGFNPPENGGNI